MHNVSATASTVQITPADLKRARYFGLNIPKIKLASTPVPEGWEGIEGDGRPANILADRAFVAEVLARKPRCLTQAEYNLWHLSQVVRTGPPMVDGENLTPWRFDHSPTEVVCVEPTAEEDAERLGYDLGYSGRKAKPSKGMEVRLMAAFFEGYLAGKTLLQRERDEIAATWHEEEDEADHWTDQMEAEYGHLPGGTHHQDDERQGWPVALGYED